MTTLNKVLLIGKVSIKAKTRRKGDDTIVVFSVLTSAGGRDADSHVIHTVGTLAERCAELTEGRLVYIEGRLSTSGVVMATRVHFLRASTTKEG